jgi:septal ring factor EnvC (AmiA/AmiB activator)
LLPAHVISICALAQTEAQGALQAAEVRQKGLKKQLAEEKRKLASKEKEAGGLAQQLQREQRQVDECSARLAPAWQSLHRMRPLE